MNNFLTVVEAFLNSVETKPNDSAIHVTDEQGEQLLLTYASLYDQGCETASGFLRMGLQRGDRIVVALSASAHFYSAYLGAWFFGVIPLIVLPPLSGRGQASARNVSGINSLIQKTGAKLLVVPANANKVENWSCRSCTPEELMIYSPISPCSITPNSIAHLQCTSGSTGEPRLVIVRHRNIAANVIGIGKAIKHKPDDKLVSWLPLSHDMGLIGISYSLGWQCPLIASATSRFIRNPMTWLQMISDHKGTLSPAPNSAFLACARLAKLRSPRDINLSTWRVALCGSEPVQESTILQFEESFNSFGFKPEAMLPVYGLAEATLAATIPDPDTIPHVESIAVETMVTKGCIETSPTTSKQQTTQRLVALGSILLKHDIRIVDATGRILPENNIGEIELFGPSVTDGYWQDEQATKEILRADGYLRTGDLGFLKNGQLYVSGRKKDIIIIGGRNFSPSYIEQLVFDTLDPCCIKMVVAIGITCNKTGTEALHLLIDAKSFQNNTKKTEAEIGVRDAILNNCGISGVMIHWVSRDMIPYTTSGKVQRYLCKEIIQHQLPSCEKL